MARFLQLSLTADRLREVFAYDPETGIFTRLVKTGGRSRLGYAGTKHHAGGLTIRIDNYQYEAHRLAWLYVHGRWPALFLDHVDGNRANNRISNLREATTSQNMQNLKRARSDNVSGFLGVAWNCAARKWVASIRTNGKLTHLGCFDEAAKAHEVYVKAKRQLHPFGTL